MNILLESIRERAQTQPAGYFEEVCALGAIDGAYLVIAHERKADYEHLFRRVRGLGDAVEIFAKPIARAIDAIAGTDLQNCAGCAQRQAALNEQFPL